MPFADLPKPPPEPKPNEFAQGLTLLKPLSRKGIGPGLVVVVDDVAAGARIVDGIPTPLTKWAEEGYTVVELRREAFDTSFNPLQACCDTLKATSTCDTKGKVGLICYSSTLWDMVSSALSLHTNIVASVVYADATSFSRPSDITTPLLAHLTGPSDNKSENTSDFRIYRYPDQTSPDFATPLHDSFIYATEAVSHTRNLTFLKKHIGGPYFDLETIWEEHAYYEFEKRDVEATMNTMVAEPYVNHIPTITGGIGRKGLTDFYTNHFVFSNPEGTAMELISRTVGIDRVVDEFVFKLNHNKVVDWLLPGVPPTYKDLAIPFMAVVNIRGDRLYHEHITWDQATALRQAGILPEHIRWKGVEGDILPRTNGHSETSQKDVAASILEIRLPVAGADTVAKMRDKNSVPSNEMIAYKPRKVVDT